MAELNESIKAIPLPEKMKKLPVSSRGYPVPWFVAYVDGDWDFRVIEKDRFIDAVRQGRCWLCGDRLGTYKAFVVGPMCTVNRVSAEPPSHLDCATYAVMACPFLAKPKMRRNEDGLEEMQPRMQPPSGVMIKRNPGVAAIWVTKAFKVFIADNSGGPLIEMGEPERVLWYANGRAATREEVDESMRSGMPELEKAAAQDGREGMKELKAFVKRAMKYLPEARP